PHGHAPAKLFRHADLPNKLAVIRLQTCYIAPKPNDIEPIAIHRRGAPRALFALPRTLPKGWSKCGYPDLTSVFLRQGPNDFLLISIGHAVYPPLSNRWCRVTTTKVLNSPRKRRPRLGPC